jgi:hypothetical protein
MKVVKALKWFARRTVAFLFNWIFMGYSNCGCCKRAWPLVRKHHCNDYSRGRAMFPLCEACWKDLTPEQRMPYYMKLIDSWEESSDGKNHNDLSYSDIRKAIFTAVSEGK